MSHDADIPADEEGVSTGHIGLPDATETLPDEAIDEIAFLARSPVRVRVLHTLRGREYVERRELRERIDGVRTTVTRNLSALEDRGWIEHTTEGYTITSCGRMIADELIELAEKMSLAVDLRPALRWLDIEQLDIGLQEFERAEITTADSTNPYAPVDEQVELLRQSETVKAAFPSVNRQILEVCQRTAERNESMLELVVDAETIDRFGSEPSYADLFESVLERCTVYEYDGVLPHYVGIGDERAQIGTTDGNNVLRVLLELNGEPKIHNWATDRFEWYKERADTV